MGIDIIGGIKSVGNKALGLATGGLAGDEDWGIVDNIAGGVGDYFTAGTRAAEAQQEGANKGAAAVESGYNQAIEGYGDLAQQGMGDFQDFRGNVQSGAFGVDPITTQYQNAQQGQSAQYQGFDQGQGPSYQNYSLGAGPQNQQFQRGQGPQAQQYQRGQGPQNQQFQRGQGPNFTGADQGQFNFDFQQDPGYQFRMEEGMKAIDSGRSASGSRLSGGADKDRMRFAQGLASEEYGKAYGRQRGEFESNRAMGEREAGRRTGFDVNQYQHGTGQDFASQQAFQQGNRADYQYGNNADMSGFNTFNQGNRADYQYGTNQDFASQQAFQNAGQQNYQYSNNMGFQGNQNQNAFNQGNYQFNANMNQSQNQYMNNFNQSGNQYDQNMGFNINQANNQGNLNTNLQNYNMNNQQANQSYNQQSGLASTGLNNIANMANLQVGQGEAMSNAYNQVANANANRVMAPVNTFNDTANLVLDAGATIYGAKK